MTRPHRALILQGGGALGAYEAGAVLALVQKLAQEDKENDAQTRPVFDIVAGSSIGAVNAVILVNSVLAGDSAGSQADRWLRAAHDLERFWKETIPTFSILDIPAVQSSMNFWWSSAEQYREFASQIWKSLSAPYEKVIESMRTSPPYLPWYFLAWPNSWPSLATGESARRYLEYLGTLRSGAKNVLAGAIPQAADMKFLNPAVPLFLRFDNSPLLSLIQQKHWPGGRPIQTTERDPRLILVAVDVQNCSTAVAFDSYPKQDGKRYTEYGGDSERHVIEYEGILPDHLLASMSTHLRYKYPEMKTKEGKTRVFWDGAYLSNTPLREVIQSHRDYWKDRPGGVPDLEVFIVNLYPAIDDTIPSEPDSIQDREVDIKFHDRTKYDLKAAQMTSDLIDLIKQLRGIIDDSEGNAKLKEQVRTLLATGRTKSKKRDGRDRTYQDLLSGRFSIVREVYVERTDDKDTIYGKAFDFSSSSLLSLFKNGYENAARAYSKANNQSQLH